MRRGPLFAFAAFGAFWGAWGVLLPSIKEQTGASVSELGVALVFIAVAALPAMLATGLVIDRAGSRVLPLALLFFAAAVVLPGFVHSVAVLAAVLLLVGAASGAVDVGINVAATSLEASARIRIMQAAHALFSAGFLVAAVLVGVAREAGAEALPVLVAVAMAVVVAAAFNRQPWRTAARPRTRPRLRASRALLGLGLLCAVAFVVESGIENWSALYLETRHGASPALSGLGPGFFAAAMVAGRTVGQRLEARVGDRSLLAGGALLSALGLATAAAAPSVAVALVGFLLGGAGISVAAPTLFGAAGREAAAAERGAAISTVTTLSYLGFLAGPPVIGAVSGALSLRAGMVMLAVIATALALVTASFAGGALPLRRVEHLPRRQLP